MLTNYNPVIGVISSFIRDVNRDNLAHKQRMAEIYSQSEVINRYIDTINENQKLHKLNLESINGFKKRLLDMLEKITEASIYNNQKPDTELCIGFVQEILKPTKIEYLEFPIDKINFNSNSYKGTNSNYNKLGIEVTHSKKRNKRKKETIGILE